MQFFSLSGTQALQRAESRRLRLKGRVKLIAAERRSLRFSSAAFRGILRLVLLAVAVNAMLPNLSIAIISRIPIFKGKEQSSRKVQQSVRITW